MFIKNLKIQGESPLVIRTKGQITQIRSTNDFRTLITLLDVTMF